MEGRGGKESAVELTTVTLGEILDRINAPSFIHFMSLDIEGAELEALKGVPFDRYRFGAMAIEHNDEEPKRTDLVKFLGEQGYRPGPHLQAGRLFCAAVSVGAFVGIVGWRLLEHVTVFAVSQVEFVADDRPVHGVGAVDQLAVDDGVGAEVVGQVGGAARIPAFAMSFFRIHEAILAEIQ